METDHKSICPSSSALHCRSACMCLSLRISIKCLALKCISFLRRPRPRPSPIGIRKHNFTTECGKSIHPIQIECLHKLWLNIICVQQRQRWWRRRPRLCRTCTIHVHSATFVRFHRWPGLGRARTHNFHGNSILCFSQNTQLFIVSLWHSIPVISDQLFSSVRCQWTKYRSSAWIISAHRSRLLWANNWIFLHIVGVLRRMSFTRIPFCFIIAHCKREYMLWTVENGWHKPFHCRRRHHLHVLAIQQMEDERAHAPILSIQRRWRWKMWEDRWLSSLSLSFSCVSSRRKKQQTLC